MKPKFLSITEKEQAQVAISGQLLAQLISQGLVHCSDLKCLNSAAKSIMWQSLLNSSVQLKD
ncbi:hypothetical protein [Thalassotalea marina]|uniref:Uncharacterized protein n=1 Tax=Thalassotalea marina TaxID=1673741 RepID=A0A919BEP8_9GAMM|nr:hypothetical protein [Thalassotalea marina]GHF85707.1 hypothetical protein GCM10017161_11630 [Thalassotalea marina]